MLKPLFVQLLVKAEICSCDLSINWIGQFIGLDTVGSLPWRKVAIA